MKVSELAAFLSATVVQDTYDDREITTCYTGDLLSDVMGNAPDEAVLVTIQAHKNTLAVAELKDSPAIVVCNNRPCPDDFIETAREQGVALLVTKDDQFTVSGKLYPVLTAGGGAAGNSPAASPTPQAGGQN